MLPLGGVAIAADRWLGRGSVVGGVAPSARRLPRPNPRGRPWGEPPIRASVARRPAPASGLGKLGRRHPRAEYPQSCAGRRAKPGPTSRGTQLAQLPPGGEVPCPPTEGAGLPADQPLERTPGRCARLLLPLRASWRQIPMPGAIGSARSGPGRGVGPEGVHTIGAKVQRLGPWGPPRRRGRGIGGSGLRGDAPRQCVGGRSR